MATPEAAVTLTYPRCETCGHPRRAEIAIALTRGDLHRITAAIRSESVRQTARILRALGIEEEKIMGVIEDLTAADAALTVADQAVATGVAALATEQSTFLSDIAAAIAEAGTDPAAIAEVTADINAKAADLTAQAQNLTALAAAQAAADPATPPAAPTDGSGDTAAGE